MFAQIIRIKLGKSLVTHGTFLRADHPKSRRPRQYLSAAFRLLALLCTFAAGAPQVRADNPRLHVDATEYPWSAIGRLNIAGRGWCTAVLVSERHILTAAHCLWNPVRQAWWPAESVHFVAGYQGGEALLHSLLKSYVTADGYRHEPAHDINQAATDWVVAELAEPVGREAGWLAVGNAAGKPASFGQAGYRAESRHAMTLDYGCHLVGVLDEGRVLWDDCDAAHGDSGGPVLSFLSDGPHVMGIVVLSGKSPDRTLTGIVSVAALGDLAHFPVAARAALQAGVGKPGGHAPPVNGKIGTTPKHTLLALGCPDQAPATMEALARYLTK